MSETNVLLHQNEMFSKSEQMSTSCPRTRRFTSFEERNKEQENIFKYFVLVIWFQIMSWEGLCNFCFDLSQSECLSEILAGCWSRSRSSTAADPRPQVRQFSRWPCRWTGQLESTQIFYQDINSLFKSLFVIIKLFAAASTTLRLRRGPCSV